MTYSNVGKTGGQKQFDFKSVVFLLGWWTFEKGTHKNESPFGS